MKIGKIVVSKNLISFRKVMELINENFDVISKDETNKDIEVTCFHEDFEYMKDVRKIPFYDMWLSEDSSGTLAITKIDKI